MYDTAFSEALDRSCPDVSEALNNPMHPDLDHIDSIAWVYAGEGQGMIKVDWRDKRILPALRATAFAVAQVAAVLARGTQRLHRRVPPHAGPAENLTESSATCLELSAPPRPDGVAG